MVGRAFLAAGCRLQAAGCRPQDVGARLSPRLPLIRTGLVTFSAIYLARGLILFTTLVLKPGLIDAFAVWSSRIVLV